MNRQEAVVRWAVALAPFMAFAAFPLPIPALPAISADLGVGTADLQLLISGYALGLGALLIPCGVLVDRYGPVRVWIAAMAGFALFGALGAVAPGAELLVGTRIGQGAAGAGLMASSLTLVATALPPSHRAGATAQWGAAIGAGLVVGPLAGGMVLEFGYWRPAFLGLAIVALGAAGLGFFLRAVGGGGGSARLDVVGTATLAGGIGALIFAISSAGTSDWGSPGVVLGLIAAVALLVGFALGQRRSVEPMIDVVVLRHREYVGGLVAGLALAMSALSMMVVIGPYLQVVVGASALVLGLWFLPFTGLAFLVALLGAPLVRRLSLRSRLVAGLGLSGAGMAALLPIDAGWTWPLLLPGMALVGIGVGLANPALGLAAIRSVPPHRSGVAAGVANTARQLGNALGIVVLGAALQAAALHTARADSVGGEDAAAHVRIAEGDLAGARSLGGRAGGDIVQLYQSAQTAGVRVALLVAIAMAVAGAIGTAWLMRPAQARPTPGDAPASVRET